MDKTLTALDVAACLDLAKRLSPNEQAFFGFRAIERDLQPATDQAACVAILGAILDGLLYGNWPGQPASVSYTREQFEAALAAGKVKARMAKGSLWSVRRNGKTKTWKRDTERWEIPIKIGFKTYGTVTQDNLNSGELVIED